MRFAPALILASAFALHASVRADSAEPKWLDNTPLVMAGSWDHSAIFETRLGTATVASAEEFRREGSEETVRQLHDLGVTLVILPFYKGFGLAAEKDAIDITRRMIPIYHKYGIRVGVYVGSTIAYETFLTEVPEAKEWFVPDYEGQPVRYFNQYFRKRVYFMHPGYRAYIKKVIRVAIQDLHADLIHFDNTSLQAAIPIFHHPMAAADFRAYLRNRYTPAQLKARLGFSDVSYVEPPHIPPYPGGISDPLAQEWMDFRCHQLQAYYAEMTSYIRSLNPEVADDCNPSAGLNGTPTLWLQGVDYPRLVPRVDIVWSEEGSKVGLEDDGILWSKIRTYKAVANLGRRVFAYTNSNGKGPMLAHAEAVDHPKIAMAEAMAFNRGCLGQVCQPLLASAMPKDQVAYVAFALKNYGLLVNDRSRAQVAVLRSFASLGYNTGKPWQGTMLAEQALLEGHVDFDILYDSHLSELSRYRVLVLADQESLSDEQIAAIAQFVQKGGGVVTTEGSANYDGWRRPRAKASVLGRFGVATTAGTPSRGELGRGRMASLAALMPVREKPESVPMSLAYAAEPQNADEFRQDVLWAAGGDLDLTTDAPSSVVISSEETRDGTILVNLLNYGAEKAPHVANVTVGIRGGTAAKSVRLLSPDGISQDVSWRPEGDRLRVHVPRLDTYDLIVISQ